MDREKGGVREGKGRGRVRGREGREGREGKGREKEREERRARN
jgi:hypothetical protein